MAPRPWAGEGLKRGAVVKLQLYLANNKLVEFLEATFRFSASDFILRAQNKVTKQKGTPATA